jgi:CRISPR-associated protein (TIGR02584 family)
MEKTDHLTSRLPQDHPVRILLAVTGLSPQVVTETVYALSQADHPFIPTEIHVLTTEKGAGRAQLTLLSREPGWFHRLRRDYGLPEIRFGHENIHILSRPDGSPIADIRDPEDNARAADLITDMIRRFTGDAQSALHVSIAGGRKTMGFFAGYALSLYGRTQDRLSHVLVSAPYESNQEFFYPATESRIIYGAGPNSEPMDTAQARVTLADIPFVRLRHGLDKRLLSGEGTYTAAVQAVQRSVLPPRLVVTAGRAPIRAGETDVPLLPVDKAFYLWMAARRKLGLAPLACPRDGVPEPDYTADFLAHYRQVLGELDSDERTALALRRGMEKNYFERRKSAVNKALKQALGPAAAPYLIARFGTRPNWRHGVGLEPHVVVIE